MSESLLSLNQVNDLSLEDFIVAFGDVGEHSPWVAEQAADARPFANRRAMAEAFIEALLGAGDPQKLALVRAHPDLAGRAAITGSITDESKREQAGAGLDRLTPEEFGRFKALNDAYREKFRFPFILAVKGLNKSEILSSFEKRMGNDPETELANAIRQVAQIVASRIADRVSP